MGNDCTQNCSDNELNELFHLVTGIMGLNVTAYDEGVRGEAYTAESVFWW